MKDLQSFSLGIDPLLAPSIIGLFSKKCNFVQRNKKLNESKLIKSLIAVSGTPKYAYGQDNGYTILDILREYNHDLPISEQITEKALRHHLGKNELCDLTKLILKKTQEECFKKSLPSQKNVSKITQTFLKNGIEVKELLLWDGSYKHVSPELHKDFKASRSAKKEGSLAEIGIQTEFSLTKGVITHTEITSGACYEPNFYQTKEKTIIIADGGFYNKAFFADAEIKDNAYFVCPLRRNTAGIIISAKENHKEVSKYNNKKLSAIYKSNAHILECTVELPRQDKIALVNSKGEVEMLKHKPVRIRAIRYFDYRDHTYRWIGTSLPQQVPASAILALMKMRWQIELAFKELKSFNNFRAAKTSNKSMTVLFVYVSLITYYLKRLLLITIENQFNTKISITKLCRLNTCSISWFKLLLTIVFAPYRANTQKEHNKLTDILISNKKYLLMDKPSKNAYRNIKTLDSAIDSFMNAWPSTQIFLLEYKSNHIDNIIKNGMKKLHYFNFLCKKHIVEQVAQTLCNSRYLKYFDTLK